MAKLRVGDILIEDSRIRIGDHQVVGSRPEREGHTGTAESPAPLAWLRDAPVSTRLIGWTGAGLAMVGFVAALAATAWDDPIRALFRGGFLIPVGAGLMATAFLKYRLRAGAVDLNRLALGQAANDVVGRLRSVLGTEGKHRTIEWIVRRTGLDEVQVVRGLAVLRDRGELGEELDSDSGDFYYHLARRTPQDLDSRLATIDHGRHM